MKKVFLVALLCFCVVLSACGSETETETPNQNAVFDFFTYDEYLTFFRDAEVERLDEQVNVPASPEMKAYIQCIQEDPQQLKVPFHSGAPVALREENCFSSIVLQKELYNFLWSCFFTKVGDASVRICLSELSAEHTALASEMTCSAFIAVISPTAPNVNNYQDKEDYQLISEDDFQIGEKQVSALISQTKNGEEYIKFVLDGFFVNICAPTDVITDDWLQDFAIASYCA